MRIGKLIGGQFTARPRLRGGQLTALAALAVGLLLCTTACTPALNWRKVELGGMGVLLPCKPDHAERDWTLAGVPLRLQMVGCEAGGGLFAVSRLELPDAAMASQVVQAWRESASANMQAQQVQALPQGAAQVGGQWAATGRNAQGAAVQAQWAWYVRGAQVFHVAVYAPSLSPEMTQTLFAEVRLP